MKELDLRLNVVEAYAPGEDQLLAVPSGACPNEGGEGTVGGRGAGKEIKILACALRFSA